MKLYVLRHGETNENITGIMQGNMETVLNELGRKQAESVRNKVKEAGIDLVISSPKKRAVETAQIAAPNIPIILDDRLLSRNHGEFEGMQRNQVNLKDYWNIKLNKQFEKAESMGEIFNRVSSLLNDISINYSDKTVLLVIHGGISVAINAYFFGIPSEENPTYGSLKNCEVKVFDL